MLKGYVFVVSLAVILATIPSSFADAGKYDLKVDEKTFSLPYTLNGTLISMGIDKEAKSLLIGITNVGESTFEVSFPSELLSAENDEFVVLLDGIEAEYAITHADNMAKLSLAVPAATEEIEVIGSSVIPEFPFGALVTMGIVSVMVLVFSRTNLMRPRW